MMWDWTRESVAIILRTHVRSIPDGWLTRPAHSIWLPKRRRAVLWILANFVAYRLQQRHKLTCHDYCGFLRRAKWKLHQATRRHESVGNYLRAIIAVEHVWNVMAHAQKPGLVFQRNGRVHWNLRGRPFSRLLAAEVCASAVVMLDTPCSEVVWRVLAAHSIRQFPLHFPSRASPSAITFQLESTSLLIINGRVHLNLRGRPFSRLLAAEVCASAVVMLDAPCSEVVWRVLATHCIRQFPYRASPCAITFELSSTNTPVPDVTVLSEYPSATG